MSARVTRSTTNRNNEICAESKNSVDEKKIRRRQRKQSTSSDSGTGSSIDKTAETNKKDEQNVTPPKQGKFQRNPKTEYSPRTLIERLSIDDKIDVSETTSKPRNAKKPDNIQSARKVLHIAETENLHGREKELEELSDFLGSNLKNGTSASMYISGQPGTGKTACIRKLLNTPTLTNKFKKVYINCTCLQSSTAIFKAIGTELGLKVGSDRETNEQLIENYLCRKNHKMLLLILDEIDELIEKKQSVLYTIFEWPCLLKSKLLLIGIANSLDLTNRALTRLQTLSSAAKPRLMHFAPYTKQQIIEIFKSRLEEAGVCDVFPLATIHLLSAKVAAISGDVRRALDIGRRVVEQARSTTNANDIDFEQLGVAELDAPPKQEKVEMKQVLNVLNSVYSTAGTLNDDGIDAFPLQQKILVCALLLILKSAKNKDITISRLHRVYAKLCAKRNIQAIDETEFSGVCSLIETKGIIRVIKGKILRLNKIQLQWDQDEIMAAIKDKQLITDILADTSCLE